MRESIESGLFRRALPAIVAASAVMAACGSDASTTPSQEVMDNIKGVNEQCNDIVIEDVKDQYYVVQNDESTPEDEAYDSRKAAQEKAGPLIEDMVDACMEQNLPGITGYDIEYPAFEPEIRNDNE